MWYLLPSNPTGPWNPVAPCSPLEPGGAGMPPLPWSPGSPGEPLKPWTNNSYKHGDRGDTDMLPTLLTRALLAICLIHLSGLPIYTMVLAQAKSTNFIGKGCWDQGYLSPTVLIFHSCYHNTSLMRLVARGALHWVHAWLTLQSLGCKHVHEDMHISTKEVLSWFKWDPYLMLLCFGYVSVVEVFSYFAYVLNAGRRKA